MRTLARRQVLSPVAVFLLAASLPATASAHVKWFSNFSFADRPRTLQEALTPTTWVLIVLSAVVLGVLVFLDRRLAESRWVNWVNQLLERYQNQSLLVMRIGIAATLLLAWDGDSMLMPELKVPAEWIGWVQFLVVLLLLFPATVRIACVGVGFLYVLGIPFFGPLHMLDYAFFAGTAWYFYSSSFRSERWRATGLPALYATVGFSLCWVSLEKLIYPDWALYVLQQDPELTMGFPLQFFLTSTAFIEFTLGYLLIICLSPTSVCGSYHPDLFFHDARIWKNRNHRAYAVACSARGFRPRRRRTSVSRTDHFLSPSAEAHRLCHRRFRVVFRLAVQRLRGFRVA